MRVSAGWERIRTLFHAALDQPADARATFLSSACEGDETMRREVESLLAAHGASDGFLESPAVDLDAGRGAEQLELEDGVRIGNFEVIGSLGAGGMGEVYRARDTQLRREVAIKLLPRALADDPRRLTRFERESRILAALNHPNIATIHSIEHADGLHALVMELVEGPTLADRLKQGALEWRDALVLARELEGALEAAHDKGVVHRDLKPANIKFSSSGRLKLLDFGLAKELADHEVAPAPSAQQPADALKTTDGLVLGTCAYMSPEQARGLPVDKRTDVWGFGCLLFEMLAGRRAFAGETVSETITAVLEREPDWSGLPEEAPQPVRRLLRRCLEKDPHRRLHDIADARIEIDDALAVKDHVPQPPTGSGVRKRVVKLASIVALSAGCLALGWWLRNAVVAEVAIPLVTRSTWTLPASLGLDSHPAVSPDGKHVAFTAFGGGTSRRLFVRPFSALEARGIPGTEGAKHPFWSPDGRSLAYFAPGKLMKVAIDGASPIPYGQRLAAVERDGEHLKVWEERAPINWPRLSPDGRRLVYQRIDARAGSVDLWVEDLERGSRLRITKDGAAGLLPVWSPDGRQIAYLTGSVGKSTIVISAADGTSISAAMPCPGARCVPTDWSPDGRSLLATVYGSAGADVWKLSIGSDGTSRPLLAESYVERDGRLSSDGNLVAYVSEQTGRPEVSVHTVGGPLARDVLSVGGGDQPVWSRDGRELFFVDPQGSLRSVTVSRAPDGRPVFGRVVQLKVPRIGSGHWGTQYDVSPDGRRIHFLDRHIDAPPSEISIVLGWRALLK